MNQRYQNQVYVTLKYQSENQTRTEDSEQSYIFFWTKLYFILSKSLKEKY